MPYRTCVVARLPAYVPPVRNVAQPAPETVGSPDGGAAGPLLDGGSVGVPEGLDGGSDGLDGGSDGLDGGELGSEGGEPEGGEVGPEGDEVGPDGGEPGSVGSVLGGFGGVVEPTGALGSSGDDGFGPIPGTDPDEVHHHVVRPNAGWAGGAAAPARELATAGAS